ncbi:MAG: hypothetical protein QM783_15175 [Phycisphaerales bacterium]
MTGRTQRLQTRRGDRLLQLILLVLGIFAAVRLPKLLGLKPESQRGVDPNAFAQWRKVEISAAIWLIAATIGVAVLQFGGAVVIGLVAGAAKVGKAAFEQTILVFTVATFALFFALLVVAALRGSKARKLKIAAGIRWP